MPSLISRTRPYQHTNGWCLWAGELSGKPGFFEPRQIEHLIDIAPDAHDFLGLAPGWRFLFRGGYRDV
jgi:hypothetical protein